MPKRDYHNYWVYIVTNKPNGTLYIGVTGGIDDRIERHKMGKEAYLLQNTNCIN
jgi:putative endonuclease